MNYYESSITKTKRKRRWLWYWLLVMMIGSVAFFTYPRILDRFLQREEEKKLSQERWLYWCPTSFQLSATSSCHYMNRDGMVVAEAPRLEGKLFPKLYDERETPPIISPPYQAPQDLLSFVREFYDLGQFVLKNDDTLEIGWPGAMQIKVSLKDNHEHIAANLALILEKEIGERRDEVDYIDLRFGNRVYYKYE